MALVVVVVTDEPNGHMNVQVHAEPPFPGDRTDEYTDAQYAVMQWLSSAVDNPDNVIHDIQIGE